MDAHEPVSGEKVVRDYPFEWDGSGFHVRGPEIQAVGGIPYYARQSADGVVMRKNTAQVFP